MKKRHISTSLALVLLLLLCPLLLTGCGSEEASAIQVVVGNTYVDEDHLATVFQQILAEDPSWQREDLPVELSAFSFGAQEIDAGMFGANVMKVSAMIASGEMDILICDAENAARYARSETFVPVDQIIPEDELDGYQERLLSFELLDEDGTPTGSYTPACGISLNGDPRLDAFYPEQEYGIFLVGNAEPMETAEQLFMDILNG